MASSSEVPMPQTIDAYIKLAERDLVLIIQQKSELASNRREINDLRQKLKKHIKKVLEDKPTTKICPKCGDTRLALISTQNLKICSGCGEEILWVKEKGESNYR